MSTLDRIRPRIQPNSWPGRDRALHRSLTRTPKIPGTPWVSLCFDTGTMLAYAGDSYLEKHEIGAEALEKKAIENMASVPAVWETMDLGLEAPALNCRAATPVAERVLDSDFMGQAHETLGEVFLAIIPQRQTLIAGPYDNPDAMLKLAQHLTRGEGLTDWVLAIREGKIIGRVVEEDGQLIVDVAI